MSQFSWWTRVKWMKSQSTVIIDVEADWVSIRAMSLVVTYIFKMVWHCSAHVSQLVFIFCSNCFYLPSRRHISGGGGVTREYWMIIEKQDVPSSWFGSFPAPSPPHQSVYKLDWRNNGKLRKRGNFITGQGGRWMGWARNQIIRRRESLAIYQSCDILRASQRSTYWT